jgi:osmoprotectant transport system substrate-binding protein
LDRKTILGCCLSAAILLSGCSSGGQRPVAVGSKNFTESVLVGEIVAQHLERRGIPVTRRLNLGGTLLAHQSLVSREIDLYPEYTGTAFTNILKHDSINDPGVVLERVRTEYSSGMGLEWLNPLGFDDSFAMTVRGADARARHLETLSDAANDPKGFSLGAGYEFLERPDGFAMLNQTYAIKWNTTVKSMDLGLLYTALQQNQVSMVAGGSTDGVLTTLDLKVLQDDKHAFPPYQACLVVRADTIARVPNLRAALSELSGKFTTVKMRQLNYEVDGKHRRESDVAKEFLDSAGL